MTLLNITTLLAFIIGLWLGRNFPKKVKEKDNELKNIITKQIHEWRY